MDTSNVIISKFENMNLGPDGDIYHSQNLMGSKLDQDPSSEFFTCRSNQ